MTGLKTDANGALVVTTDATDAEFEQGFLRSPLGELVLSGVSGSSTVVSGADPNTPRPEGAPSVIWIGSVLPNNYDAATDAWIDTTTPAATVYGLWKPGDSGLLGSTFDAGVGGAAFNLVRGTVHAGRVPLADAHTISSLEIHVQGAGVALANCFAGVYALDGTLLGSTADQSGVWTSTGVKTMPLTAPITVTGDVIVAIICVTATTVPAVMFTNNYASAAGLNRGLAPTAARACSMAGQAGLPAVLAPGLDSRIPWIGVA
jgi:hypothetical protein